MYKTLVLISALVFTSSVAGQTANPEDPAHQELRQLRTNVVDAIVRGDFDQTVKFIHTNAVITWQNTEVCRGHTGLQAFFYRMGKDAFKGYKVSPKPDELTILHGGDTGISFGQTVAHYRLFGKDFDFTNRWTATLVKDDGGWKLAAYHVSNNVLNNPLLNSAKNALFLAGIGGLIVGLLIGLLLGRRNRRSV